MRKTFLGILLGLTLLLGYTSQAEAGALLNISTGAFSVSCNNTLAFSGTNCSAAAGYLTVANSSSIFFNGPITGYQVTNISVGGNQPGTATAGNVLDSK